MPITVTKDVQRDQVWARIMCMGPSGSGKSRGALELASRLFGGELPVTLINTEPNRGKLYADRFRYSLVDLLDDYHPHRFIEAMDIAEGQLSPGGVIVLDSASHEWYGTNGITQQATRFGDWSKARPLHQEFVDRINRAQAHVIVCVRAKMKYEQQEVEENGRTKKTVVALGVGPMQDADFQFEFSLVGMFEQATHDVTWSGHMESIVDTTTQCVGEQADLLAEKITAWCSKGEPIEAPPAAAAEAVTELVELLTAEGFSDDVIQGKFDVQRKLNRGALHPDYVATNIESAKARAAKKAEQQPAAEAKAEGPPESAPAAA